jgi:integrase
MSDGEIKVTVIKYPDRGNLVLCYVDPVSGKRKTRSAKTANEKAAWKAAAAWEDELRAGPLCPPSKVTWQQFRERYETEHLANLKPKTRESACNALDAIERHLSPDLLRKVNAGALSTFATKLRQPRTVKRGDKEIKRPPIKETTVANILRHVKAALSWAVTVGLLASVPKIITPKGSKGRKMKGGALVGEQFDRLVATVAKIRPKDTAEWERYLNGLWLSGLRLSESVALSWDADAPFAVDLSGRRPRFRIKGEAQKSGQDELLPMTPDFADLLLQTPEAERHGRVFRLNEVETGTSISAHSVGQLVASIGKRAGAIVNAVDGKTASAHDLRRSFASRWAKRVAPAILQKLMRHASIQTTMGYYVDLDVDEMADELWANHPVTTARSLPSSNISGNNCPESPENTKSPTTISDCEAFTSDSEGDGNRTRNHRIDSQPRVSYKRRTRKRLRRRLPTLVPVLVPAKPETQTLTPSTKAIRSPSSPPCC